jgi:hypothetical protein
VSRSKQFDEDESAGYDPKNPPLVSPGLEQAIPVAAQPVAAARPAEKAVVVNLRH